MTIVVVAIIAVPLSLFLGQHFESLFLLKDYSVGANLARLEMETVYNSDYASITSATFASYQGYPYDVRRVVRFAAGDDLSQESLKEVIVSVERSGSAANVVSMTTYIAKNVSYGL